MQHLEDLPLAAFIKAVKNIGTMHASEKLDGSNLWLGLDEDGKLYTSREGKRKGSKPFYSEGDYPRFAAYNGFRAAHAALQHKIEDIKRVMQPNQMVEMEVLYGRQPNAVTYGADGKSYIAFLRGVEGTPDVIADQLTSTLGGQSVKVRVEIIETADGENLDLTPAEITYQFTGAQRIPTEKLKDVQLDKILKDLEDYLQEPAGLESSPELSNMQVLQNSLGSIPVKDRPAAKDKKEEITAKVMTGFRLPIKRELLDNYISKIKPALGDKDVTADEDVGIEGVVLRDPTTGDLFKIVDKDTFTTINTFNHTIRNQISGVVKTLDGHAPLEARGGILGNMKIQIADLLGNKELARGATAKKALEKVKGATPVDTVKAFAANLDIDDFLGTKRKLLALVQQAAKDLKALLEDFKANKDNFQLKLKNGKTIGISREIEKRTLLVFAESHRNISELFDKIKAAKSVAQVVAIMYGHHAKAVNNAHVATVNESRLILEKKPDTDKALYKNKDAFTLLNIYFATVFMTVIIYKADDTKGIRLLKDRSHYRMTAWTPTMSQLNFWGYPIWHSSSPVVKKLIGPKAANALFKVARHADPSRSRLMHMDLSAGKDVPIEWSDHQKTLRVLQRFEGMATDRINILMNGVFKYDELDHDGKVKLMSKLFFYIQQFIPTSPLFFRIKAIQDKLILNANGENDEMVQERLIPYVNALVEDEMGNADPTASQNTPAVDVINKTTSDPKDQGTINRSRRTVKRKRNPDVKKARFTRPESETENKETQ
ncbi:hypothetical protein [Acinetobacter sp.]|uniref:hypothetical protein n=1 Tax=Acinetobacter sp. TaxID=472 RepID=UPI003890E471